MTIPEDNGRLAGFGETLIEGYRANCAAWGVPLSFAEEAHLAHREFIGQEADYREVAALISERLLPASQEADRLVEQILRTSNKVISLKVGERYNDVWAEAGHQNETTRIPDRIKDRIALLKKLKAFYGKRSVWQNPVLGLTVQSLGDCADGIDAADKAVKAQELVKAKLLKECNRSAKRLRTRLRALLSEVKHVLSADDERWSALGLSTPASHRASKDSRERKAQVRAQARTEQSAINARKRAEGVKVAFERARVRGEAAQVATDKLKEAARKLSVRADAMFLKADQLDEKVREGAAALDAIVLPVADHADRNAPVAADSAEWSTLPS